MDDDIPRRRPPMRWAATTTSGPRLRLGRHRPVLRRRKQRRPGVARPPNSPPPTGSASTRWGWAPPAAWCSRWMAGRPGSSSTSRCLKQVADVTGAEQLPPGRREPAQEGVPRPQRQAGVRQTQAGRSPRSSRRWAPCWPAAPGCCRCGGWEGVVISLLTEITETIESRGTESDRRTLCAPLGRNGLALGRNRTVAQVHALLYLAARPMDAEEITDTLGVARSNVSNSLKELQSWHLVKVVHLKASAATSSRRRAMSGSCSS